MNERRRDQDGSDKLTRREGVNFAGMGPEISGLPADEWTAVSDTLADIENVEEPERWDGMS